MNEVLLSSSAGPRPSMDRRLDRVCTEFEVALRDGGQPRIEDFLGAAAGLDHSALLVELVMLEALYRRGRGELPAAEDYAIRFPADATQIRSALAEAFPDTPPSSVRGAGVTAIQSFSGHASSDGEAREEAAGDRIGPYKLRRQIGEGGMGAVWMAEQTEPVRRSVALKLIKAGMNSRHVIARFESERQALAIMDHADIARIHDAGTTASGRPFFVMELVKGIPITEFCDKNRLAPEDRLKLFLDVCHAIQHAHHKGIIHRDIKPSNILVTLCDGAAVVKVIDFGIAKALAQKLTESTLFTAYGQMIGTPAYMSPEQAEMTGLDIDTRSDVYSLGVLLYELLTGTTPLDSKRLREAGFAEVQRLIREEEPPRPSTRVSTLGDSAATLAGNRGTDAKRLSHLLSGDLDWIVMKALDKDRSRRYATPERYAEDVERYLRRDVVLARPPSTAYRLRRFAQRNRAAVLTATAVAAALIAGMAIATWQAVRATHAESAAVASAGLEKKAKEDAETREAETKAVLTFVENRVFAAARPGQAGGLGHDVTLQTAVRAALPFLDNSFGDRPLIEARLRMTLGISFSHLGDPATAAEQYRRARGLYTAQFGPDHPATVASMNNLATAYYVLGRPADALKLFEETLALQKAKLGPDHPDTLMCMMNTASCYAALGRPADALKLYEETLALRKAKLGPDHPDTLVHMMNLATAYYSLGRPADALKLREKTLALMRAKLGRNHPETLRSMNNLVVSYYALGRHVDALKLGKETLALMKAELGPDHPDTLSSMTNLASSYAALGRHADALKLREDTLALCKAKLGPDHPDTLSSMNNLAVSYANLGRHADALTLREDTLALCKAKLGPDHPDTLRNMNNLASSYANAGRHADALKLREETLAQRKAKLSPDHPDTLWSMLGLIDSLVSLNRGLEAVPLIDDCLKRSAGRVVNSELIPGVMDLRLQYFAKAKDAAGCRATAEIWERLNRTDDGSLYRAACYRAVAAAAGQTPGADAARLTKDDADRAMAWLRQALAAGYADIPSLLADPDLAPLRGRADYAGLLWDLADSSAANPR